jgi:hypothetical protein
MTDDPQELIANGIDRRGRYLLPPVPPAVLAAFASGQPVDPDTVTTLMEKHAAATAQHYGVLGDETDLSQAGWGLMFAADDKDRVPAMEVALAPLIERRREQAGERYYGSRPSMLFRSTDTKNSYLARHQMGPGPVDPAKLPYYLLIVGSPAKIPFRFQCLLDVQFAVGRLHFDGTGQQMLDSLERYARAVVAAEKQREDPQSVPKLTAAFFGVRNNLDIATALSCSDLVSPLATELAGDQPAWTIASTLADTATKSALRAMLGGDATPAFLFTASHGWGLPAEDGKFDPQMQAYQGAIVCSDWPGVNNEVTTGHVFAADDLANAGSLAGLVAFCFACFGGGTPRLDDFSAAAQTSAIAPEEFVAALPQRMLAHPKGPALAVVGHVDRAWTHSFSWGAVDERTVFRRAIGRLMKGIPLGAAMEDFNFRYAEISTLIAEELQAVRFGATPNEQLLANYWIANSDARNYVVLGDPAVTICRQPA